MEQHKTDESVKTALHIEANSNKQQAPEDDLKEVDADELAHQQLQNENTVNPDEEQDLGELVHKIPVAKMNTDNHEPDADELVHQQ